MTAMNWLFKEEPTDYNYDAFAKDKKSLWSGVRNPVAQRNLHSVKKGDLVFYYHTGDEKAIVGIAKAAATHIRIQRMRRARRRSWTSLRCRS